MRKDLCREITAGAVVLTIALWGGGTAGAADYYWDNGAGDNDFTDPVNWADDDLPVGSARDSFYVDLAGADKAILSSGELPNFASLHVGHSSGSGEFEQTGGGLKVTQHPNNASLIGYNGYTGTWTMRGGTASINTFKIADSIGSTGTLFIHGGSMIASRARHDYSIHTGVSGTGTLEITGGSLMTRAGVRVGSNSTFSVVGAGASRIGIGSSNSLDGRWVQDSGGILKVQIATNGITPILVDYVDGTGGGGFWVGHARFETNSILDVSFLGDHDETNVWKVMEAEGGILDHGLKLADSVDTNDWAIIVTNRELYVSYGGAVIPPPTARVYVDAVVPRPDSWHLFAPESRGNSLSEQSRSGFIATFQKVLNDPPLGYRPAVAQEFTADQDISEVGQGVKVSFDVELMDPAPSLNVLDTDFRFSFYDTNANSQITSVMLDMGPPSGSTMRMRILDRISGSDTNRFVPGDYALLGLGYDTLAGAGGHPGNGLQYTGEVLHVESSITRTRADRISVVTIWSDDDTNITCSLVIDEAFPPNYMPPSGKWETISGVGFMLFDEQPFWPLNQGSFRISNFEVSSTNLLPEGFTYDISALSFEPSGDVTLILSDPVVGATYAVLSKEDLLLPATELIGSYVAEAPGTITIPAADAAPHITDTGSLGVDLPVVVIIE